MAANLITLGRILLVFVVVLLFAGNFYTRVTAVFLTALVLYLDALDGVVARKLKAASDFGALFDITGDRIVEHVYWIYFCAVGLVSFWVPIIFVSRSFLVDTLRSVAYAQEGKTPFGEKTMMRSPITIFLTSSRFSRGFYGGGKVAVFVFLGMQLALQTLPLSTKQESAFQTFAFATEILVWIVVALNLIRGFPVLWDGRHYLFSKGFPRKLHR